MQLFSQLHSARRIQEQYQASGQAAAVVDGGLFVVWANAFALERYPFLRLPDGILALLPPAEAEAARQSLARGLARACPCAGIPFLVSSLFFTPLAEDEGCALALICPPGPAQPDADRMLSVFSSQIRAPVTQIFSALHAAAGDKYHKVSPELIPHFETINSRGYQILRHCYNFTEYTRYAGGAPLETETVDLCAMTRELCHSANVLTANAGSPLILTTPKDALYVRVHVKSMQIALLNLIANACRFCGGGSIGVTLKRQGENARVMISDSGPGIDAGLLDRVCEPFFTGDPYLGGGGLGLTVAKLCAEAHSGSLAIKSSPGHTTVTITLPLAPPELSLHSPPTMAEMSCDRYSPVNVILSDACKCPWP